MILFVTDSDLNEVEFSAILALTAVHKPILLVLNKIDLYDEQELEALTESIRDRRLRNVIPPENFVTVSADPREIEIVTEDRFGRETSHWEKPPPDVTRLKARILEILAKDGRALIALNAAMYAADKTDRIAKLRIELREQKANQTIWSFAAAKALAVALNPVPIADVLGGSAVDITMVVTLAHVYGLEMSWANARGLARSILAAAGWVTATEIRHSPGRQYLQRSDAGHRHGLDGDPPGRRRRIRIVYRRQGHKILFGARCVLGPRSAEDGDPTDPERN